MICIKKDAVFIADAHWFENHNCENNLISTLQNLNASQVFLMGDITQVLVGNLPQSVRSNMRLLECVGELSKRAEVFWLEGNHDFGLRFLQDLLPDVKFIERKKQPLLACLDSEISESKVIVSLAHGDLFVNKRYHAYIWVLNSVFGLNFVKLLNALTLGKLYEFLQGKINAKRVREFRADSEKAREFCENRIKKYEKYFSKFSESSSESKPSVIIEGHFHLDKMQKMDDRIYICLPSFYVNGKVFAIKSKIFKDFSEFN